MKKLTSALLAIMMVVSLSVSAMAQAPAESPVPDEVNIVFDETGVHGASVFSRTNGPVNPNQRATFSIAAQETLELRDIDDSDFYLVAGQKINMVFSYTPKGAALAYGYMLDGGRDVIINTAVSGSIKYTFRIEEDGYYCFLLTSLYDGVITAKGSMTQPFSVD